jgi:flavin-dependent dehydrogenase
MRDIIIVGAGTAGSFLASRLKNKDLLILEKNRKIVLRDSGIVSADFKKFFPEKKLIEEEIREMIAKSPTREFSLKSEKPFAYILKRIRFAKYLRNSAKKNAEIKYEFAEKIIYEKSRVRVLTNKGEHEAKMIVGADAGYSVVRRSIGIKDPKMFLGLMVRARVKLDKIEVFFNKHYSPDFFSWAIPKKEYGLITSIRPNEHLKYFQTAMNFPEGKKYAYPVPMGYTKSFAHRTLLIGDACGQVKPLSGGGIMFSLRAALHAQRAIEEAFNRKRFDKRILSLYEKSWRKEFGKEIKNQLIFRRIYRKMSNKDIDSFFKDFGPGIEIIKDFDYDFLSISAKKLPKTKLVKHAIKKLPLLFN